MIDEISYNVGVATDLSRETVFDPDRKDTIEALDQIIENINTIEKYCFSEIKDNLNQIKNKIKEANLKNEIKEENL